MTMLSCSEITSFRALSKRSIFTTMNTFLSWISSFGRCPVFRTSSSKSGCRPSASPMARIPSVSCSPLTFTHDTV